MEIKTKTDRYIEEQLKSIIEPDETPLAFAYLDTLVRRGSPIQAYHAALTDQRLILIETRVGAFGNLLENIGVHRFGRDDIKGVSMSPHLRIEMANGDMMILRSLSDSKYTSSQLDFLARLEPFFGRSEAAEQANRAYARSPLYFVGNVRVALVMLVLALLVGYLRWRFHSH